MLLIATESFEKGYDYEQTKYGDDLYGKENMIDDVWVYYTELKEIGRRAFYEKYKDFKLY